MVRWLTRSRLAAALMALVVAVLALGPLTEAAACGFEAEPAAAATLIDDAGQPADTHDDGAGPCTHGHCHHAGSGLLAALAEVSATPPTRDVSLPPPADRLASLAPDGPRRPPRT